MTTTTKTPLQCVSKPPIKCLKATSSASGTMKVETSKQNLLDRSDCLVINVLDAKPNAQCGFFSHFSSIRCEIDMQPPAAVCWFWDGHCDNVKTAVCIRTQ